MTCESPPIASSSIDLAIAAWAIADRVFIEKWLEKEGDDGDDLQQPTEGMPMECWWLIIVGGSWSK